MRISLVFPGTDKARVSGASLRFPGRISAMRPRAAVGLIFLSAGYAMGDPNDGLVAYWPCDEGVGVVVYDHSGNGNDGVIEGASWTTGVSGSALDFDGVDDFVGCGNNEILNIGIGDFTVAFWVLVRDSEWNSILYKFSTGTASWDIHYRIHAIVTFDEGDDPWDPKDDTYADSIVVTVGDPALGEWYINWQWAPMEFGEWQHVVWVLDRDVASYIYVNGVLASTLERTSSGDISNDGNLTLGIGHDPLNGLIDEVRVYNRTLSDPEVLDLYEMGASSPTQSVVLDFETDAPFFILGIPVPFLGTVPLRLPGQTPQIDPTLPQLVTLFELEEPDKTWEDFKNDVLVATRSEYLGFRIEFVLSDDQSTLPSSERARVYYAGPRLTDTIGGHAEWTDRCNRNPMDDAIVFLHNNLINFPDQTSYDWLVRITANLTVHEVGHLLGLAHTEPESGQPPDHHMYWDTTSDDRSFVGEPLGLRGLNPLGLGTQNDRVALSQGVGAHGWIELGTWGTIDDDCDSRLTESQLVVAANTYDVHAVVQAAPDVARWVALGDLSQGEQISVSVALHPGETLTFVGSSVPGLAEPYAGGEAYDVFAYFGVPKDNLMENLDPMLAWFVPDFSEVGIQEYAGGLLESKGETFDIVGDVEGAAFSASDLDRDGDVDWNDYTIFEGCFSGENTPPPKGCEDADLDGDGDVDCDDWFVFIQPWTAPDPPPVFPPCTASSIPTVSEWGVIVMSLLGLGAGTLVFGRREQLQV